MGSRLLFAFHCVFESAKKAKLLYFYLLFKKIFLVGSSHFYAVFLKVYNKYYIILYRTPA